MSDHSDRLDALIKFQQGIFPHGETLAQRYAGLDMPMLAIKQQSELFGKVANISNTFPHSQLISHTQEHAANSKLLYKYSSSLQNLAAIHKNLFGIIPSNLTKTLEQYRVASGWSGLTGQYDAIRRMAEQANLDQRWIKGTWNPAFFSQFVHHRSIAELCDTRNPAVAKWLARQYGKIDIADSFSSALAKQFGLHIDVTEDAINTPEHPTETLLLLPDSLAHLPTEKLLTHPEFQGWLNRLSGHAKTLIINIIYHWFVLSIAVGIGNDVVRDKVKCYLPENIVGECATRHVKKEIQSIISAEDSWGTLTRFRVVKRNDVYLRAGPNERSPILEMLPVNTLLLVVDRSNRQWLEVEVDYGGERIRGWVTRRYTYPLHPH